jgi:hypothetical protein
LPAAATRISGAEAGAGSALAAEDVQEVCPTILNFGCKIEHTRTCVACLQTAKPTVEVFRDFCLNIPEQEVRVLPSPPPPPPPSSSRSLSFSLSLSPPPPLSLSTSLPSLSLSLFSRALSLLLLLAARYLTHACTHTQPLYLRVPAPTTLSPMPAHLHTHTRAG